MNPFKTPVYGQNQAPSANVNGANDKIVCGFVGVGGAVGGALVAWMLWWNGSGAEARDAAQLQPLPTTRPPRTRDYIIDASAALIWRNDAPQLVGDCSVRVLRGGGFGSGEDKRGTHTLAAREERIAHRLVDGGGIGALGGQPAVEGCTAFPRR